MTLKVILRPEAEEDLDGSVLWYERRQEGLGARFLNEVNQLLNQIAGAPLQFPQIEKDVRRGLLRHFPYGVYFTIDSVKVTILAIIHLSRHPDTWRRRV